MSHSRAQTVLVSEWGHTSDCKGLTERRSVKLSFDILICNVLCFIKFFFKVVICADLIADQTLL